MVEDTQRTACYDEHVECGGKIVDFHGFELPIWYSSIKEEHLATRKFAGLFDVSHMGFFRFSGPGVLQWLEKLATQRVTAITPGRCAYTHFLDEEGSIIDDMIFSVAERQSIIDSSCWHWNNHSDVAILGVPNASMIGVMKEWFSKFLPESGVITLEDLSEQTSILALQGPFSEKILSEVLGENNAVSPFKAQAISDNSMQIKGWIQGTGYTGERGFEIFIPNEDAPRLWRELLEKGSPHGLVPVGLGARDTLRLEKGYLLSGQDFLWPQLDSDDSALPEGFLDRDSWQTNVPFGLDMEHEFVGRYRIEESMSQNTQRWWGVKYLGKGPLPRPGKPVYSVSEGGDELGWMTSGGPSPSLENCGIGMAYLRDVSEGDTVFVQASPRGRIEAVVVRPPFV